MQGRCASLESVQPMIVMHILCSVCLMGWMVGVGGWYACLHLVVCSVGVIGAALMSCPRLSFRSPSPSRRSRRWGAQLTSRSVHFTILNSMSWTGLSHYRGSCVGETLHPLPSPPHPSSLLPPSLMHLFHCKYVVIFKVWLKNKAFWMVGVFIGIIMQSLIRH